MAAIDPLPPAVLQVPFSEVAPIPPDQMHEFRLPTITAGTSRKSHPRLLPNPSRSETPADPDSTVERFPLVPFIARRLEPPKPPPLTEDSDSQEEEKLPRSTQWYQRQVEKKKATGKTVCTNSRKRPNKTFTCHQCGELRTPDNHKQFNRVWYCQAKATMRPGQSYHEL